MSLQTKSSKLILAALFVLLFGSIAYTTFDSAQPQAIVTETVDCVVAVCKALPGAGAACNVQKPVVTKITVTNDGGLKTFTFTPTNDRCSYGDD